MQQLARRLRLQPQTETPPNRGHPISVSGDAEIGSGDVFRASPEERAAAADDDLDQGGPGQHRRKRHLVGADKVGEAFEDIDTVR